MLFLPESPSGARRRLRTLGAPRPTRQTPGTSRPSRPASTQLAEMIRSHRNHPSIVAWSMQRGLFTAAETLPAVQAAQGTGAAQPPARPHAPGLRQRRPARRAGPFGDIAGCNGDGAVLFQNPGCPASWPSTAHHRRPAPASSAAGWGDMEQTLGAWAGEPATWRPAWRARGEAVLGGFDHGSIAGKVWVDGHRRLFAPAQAGLALVPPAQPGHQAAGLA